jgi:hypothetical protein
MIVASTAIDRTADGTAWSPSIPEGSIAGGRRRSIAAMEGLDELAGLLERDPAHVAASAVELAERARTAGDAAGESRALALLGRARRTLQEVDLAERALVAAITAAERAGDADLIADAHMALAGVLSMGARLDEAFDHLARVDELGSPRLRFMGRLQRAVLCERAGRVDEALALYDEVIPQLRDNGDDLWLARMLGNRSEVHMRAGRTAQAIADLDEAGHLFDVLGQAFVGVQVRHNLAWAVAYAGDLPRALHLLDDVEAAFERLGHDATMPLVSRSEILLAAGLTDDAVTPALDAARRFEADGNRSAAAEAWLLVAHARRIDGDHAGALEAATKARDEFAELGVDGWRWAAEFEMLRSRQAMGRLADGALDEIEAVAAGLAAAGNARAHALAVALAAIVAADSRTLDRARRLVGDLGRLVRRSATLDTHLGLWEARGALAAAEGDGARARRSLRAGLAELARDRALFAVSDARTASVTLARGLTDRSLRLAAGDGRPHQLLSWMERVRAAAPVARPALPSTDDELAAAFARLRAVAVEARRTELDGGPSEGLLAEVRVIEDDIRRRLLRERAGAVASGPAPGIAELRAELADREFVSIAAAGDEYVGVAVGRRSRTVRLGSRDELDRLVGRAGRALDAAIGAAVDGSTPSAVADARNDQLVGALDLLDARLAAPLRLTRDDVVLALPAALSAAPWRALPSFAGRAVTIVPSATWWCSAQRQPARAGRAFVAAGPRLAEAEAEATAVAACHRAATVLVGGDATTTAVLAGLGGADVAHIVAHGRFRADNPLWSTLELADGPLTVYELERLARVPDTIVLASCHSGRGATRAGDRLLGLSASLLSAGARTVVVSVAALPDAPATTAAMVGLHRRLAAGRVPGALRGASITERGLDGLIGACLAIHGRG